MIFHIKSLKKIFFTLPLLLLVLLCVSCSLTQTPDKYTRSGFYFDTYISITLYDSSSEGEAYLDNAFSMCAMYEQSFSRTIEGSDIWNINHAKGSPVEVSEDTLLLLETALEYAVLSDGRIDPTIATVKDLWNFDGSSSDSSRLDDNTAATITSQLPDPDALAAACTHVDYRNILIDHENGTVTLSDPDTMLDLGFIAKGYIADRIKAYLVSQGIKHAIIDLGGNVLCIGDKPDGSAYRIGIRYPFGASTDMITSLSCIDQSIVTSGNYERCFFIDDQIYHHILDTANGYPVTNELLSVTILSPSSVQGDALSTLCYTYGLEDGMALIESLEDVEAIFVTEDYELHYSSGIAH